MGCRQAAITDHSTRGRAQRQHGDMRRPRRGGSSDSSGGSSSSTGCLATRGAAAAETTDLQ
jgi:hypothetical protein